MPITATPNEYINTFLSIISVVGCIGNLLVVFVYWKKKDKQTSTFFILLLAFTDFTVCCVLVPMTCYMEYIVFETDNVYFCKFFFFLTTTTIPSSSLLMVAIAVDRYFCICQANKNVLNVQKTKVIGIVLLVISASLGVIPALASFTISSGASTSSNTSSSQLSNQTSSSTVHETPATVTSSNATSSQCVLSHDPTFQSKFGFLVMPFKFFYDFIFLVCVITITFLYVLIYKEIYTRRKVSLKVEVE
jgi:cholecystokinin A receptor